MKAFYNSLSKPAQDNIACFLLFCVMMSLIGFATTLFMGAFFVKAIGVDGVLYVLAVFGSIAAVAGGIVKVLEV